MNHRSNNNPPGEGDIPAAVWKFGVRSFLIFDDFLQRFVHLPSENKKADLRSDDVKVLKSRWNFVKTKTATPGNNIDTLLITFIAFSSFISCKFHFPHKLFVSHTNSFYAWAAREWMRKKET